MIWLQTRLRRGLRGHKVLPSSIYGRMMDPPLNVLDCSTGVTLVPAPVEVCGHGAGLHHQDVGRRTGPAALPHPVFRTKDARDRLRRLP
jgi:hypothetical protein